MNYVQMRLAEVAEEATSRAIERENAANRMKELKRLADAQRLNAPRVGYIYFIKSGSLVKIGFTNDPVQRLAKLRNGNPHELTLLGSVPGTDDTELFFHQMFAKYRATGEWFKVDGDLDVFLSSLPEAPCERKRSVPKAGPDAVIDL